ncbi:MAG: cytochrome c biogenesis protein ResB, partial [Aeromicrobium sp.]
VYVLDKTKMNQYLAPNGKGFRISLSRGQEADLPGGGTIQFVELRQFVRFQFSSSPLVKVPLIGIVAGLLGLMISLSIKPRRTWIRARRTGSRTVVDVAALDRVPRDDLPADLDAFLERFRQALGESEEIK